MRLDDDTTFDPWTPEPPERQPVPLPLARPAREPVVTGWPGTRWQLDRGTAAAVAAALAVVAAVAGFFLLQDPGGTTVPGVPAGGQPAVVSGLPTATAVPVASASVAPAVPTPSAGGRVRVHVVGQVRRPGVVELPPGSRVEDAVDAAGGLTGRADVAAVNLARTVTDGEQIYLPRPGEEPPVAAAAASPGAAGPGVAGGALDLNAATLGQLDELPGVGPVLAQRILDHRQQRGRFGSVDELGDVSGIGDATLAKLRPLVRV